MKPIPEEVRNELKFKLISSDRFDKSSDKTKSYLNIFTKSVQGDQIIQPTKIHKNRGLISKIFQSSKNAKFHLFKYNAVKGESSDIVLDAFFMKKFPLQRLAMGKNSGYYFIYDNQGTVSVICENLKICELNLPDGRMDPTLFVYEIEFNRILLFIAGGFAIRSSGASTPSDSVAVFFLNFKDSSKILHNEPVVYIKMKYSRMHPILLSHKKEDGPVLIIFGGNVKNKFKEEKKTLDKKKSSVAMFNEGNMMCETISIDKIQNTIYQIYGSNIPILPTDDCLCLIINGKDEGEFDSQKRKIQYYFGNAGILQIKDRKKHKTSFIFGLGKDRHEIWYIDMLDFVAHKAYMYQSQSFLKKNKNRIMCNSMLTKVGEEIYYLDDDETSMYKKIPTKKARSPMALNGCIIF